MLEFSRDVSAWKLVCFESKSETMKIFPVILILISLSLLFGCDNGNQDSLKDQKPAYDYSPEPGNDISLKDYSRVIFGRFQVLPGVKDENLSISFPEDIYNKMNYHYPNAYDDVRLWTQDKPGVLVTGYIVEYNPIQRFKRILPSGGGTAIFGVEVILKDNLSNREIARFSIRHPYVRPDLKIEDVIDETAKQIAGYLSVCRSR